MRYFIALEIPSENLPQFQAIQYSLNTFIPQVKLIDLDKIHLTLAFLGEQSDSLKNNLIEVIRKAAENISSFEVTPAYIDGFPNLHHAKVLWAGVKGDIDKVLIIRERVKDGLESLRLPVDERRFIPHITIAKFNNNFVINKGVEMNLEKLMTQPFDPIKISSIKLFESVPSGSFHRHNTLAEIKLSSS